MTESNKRIAGILMVFIALLLCTVNSIAITNFTISDTDATTYIIVVMLMAFPLLLFYGKDNLLVPRIKKSNIIYGAIFLALYVLGISYFRVGLSYLFLSYRIDMLLLPLFAMSMISFVFGIDGLKRMQLFIVYLLFASPIPMLPLLSLNQPFALFNANTVYSVLSALGTPVAISGVQISTPSTYSISIAGACADIGAFVALLFFLVPVAYLYDGRTSRKVLWLLASLALMFLLNIMRMSIIAVEWAYYGIGGAAAVFHSFAGQLLFYIAIIVMMLLASEFGLYLPGGEKNKSTAAKEGGAGHGSYAFARKELYLLLAITILSGLLGFVLSTPYASSVYVPVSAFGLASQVNAAPLDLYVLSTLEMAHLNVTQLEAQGANMTFALGNNRIPLQQTYVIVYPVSGINAASIASLYNASSDTSTIVLKNGISMSGSILTLDGNTIAADLFSLPYNSSGIVVPLKYGMIHLVTSPGTQCGESAPYSAVDMAESFIYDTIRGQAFSTRNMLCESYAVAGGA